MKSQIDLNEMQPSKFPTFRALPATVKRGFKKTGRGLKKARRPVLILLLILAVAHTSVNIYASVLLNRELNIAREKGEPLSVLAMKPEVTESQNAAPLYRQAYQQSRKLNREEQNEIENFPEPEANFEARRPKILARNRQMFDLMRQAAALPGFSFEETWTQSYISLGPQYYANMRSLARLMKAQAIQEARDGNSEAALRDVRVIFQMANHLKNEPTFIGFYVAIALNGIANQSLGDVLRIHPMSQAQLQGFAASLPITDWDAAFQRAMMGERAMALPALDPWLMYQQSLFPNKMPKWQFKLLTLWIEPYIKWNEFHYLRGWRNYYNTVQPTKMPLTVNQNGTPADDLPQYATMARLMLSFYNARTLKNRNQILVMSNLRQNAFAISAYRAAHNGAYPASLKEAATAWNQALLPDPYNAKPFGYRSDGKSFTLYSVGSNRVDNNGRNALRERANRKLRARLKNPAPESADDLVWNFAR